MQTSGVLYQAGKRHKKQGEVAISKIVQYLKRMASLLRTGGTILLVFAALGLIIIYGPLVGAEVGYYLPHPDPGLTTSKFGPALKPIAAWVVPDQHYSVYIPKIQARTRVISNVDASNEQAYLSALRLGVAEAAGLAHPGQIGTTYLFAHSTDGPWNFARYNAVFYLLDKLVPGDRVEVVYNGDLHKYQVVEVQTLAASDTRYLIPQTEKELLVLQTCWPPGTSWKRLVVEARPVY